MSEQDKTKLEMGVVVVVVSSQTLPLTETSERGYRA